MIATYVTFHNPPCMYTIKHYGSFMTFVITTHWYHKFVNKQLIFNNEIYGLKKLMATMKANFVAYNMRTQL